MNSSSISSSRLLRVVDGTGENSSQLLRDPSLQAAAQATVGGTGLTSANALRNIAILIQQHARAHTNTSDITAQSQALVKPSEPAASVAMPLAAPSLTTSTSAPSSLRSMSVSQNGTISLRERLARVKAGINKSSTSIYSSADFVRTRRVREPVVIPVPAMTRSSQNVGVCDTQVATSTTTSNVQPATSAVEVDESRDIFDMLFMTSKNKLQH